MSWLAKLKEQAQEHTILGLFGLIGLLSLIVWRAVPSAAWDKVSEVTPKRALWALLALTVIAAILEGAYILLLRKRLAAKLTTKFGVKWSKDLVPHCPSCSSALTSYGQYSTAYAFSSVWAFMCVKCNERVIMSDDAGNTLQLHEAKDLLSARLSQKPHVALEITPEHEKILVTISNQRSATIDDLRVLMNLHRDRVELMFRELEREKYIVGHRTFLGTGLPTKYHLTDRGRQLLMSKGRI